MPEQILLNFTQPCDSPSRLGNRSCGLAGNGSTGARFGVFADEA